MTTPARQSDAPPMTPERWRAVDVLLQAALACDAARRDAFIAEACAGDESLRREIDSLLAAHDLAGDDFLERPAAEALGAHAPPALADRIAHAVADRYVVERELARGGMATVHLARDLRHGRRVAIKVLREELAAAVGAERFLEEIRVTASLQHPHILPLFDSGSGDGLLWYVMPYVEGETLRARLEREGPLPLDVAVRIAREIADALEYAHRHGVVHRDVKPENVLLQDGHALVADFGIALALEHAGGARLTHTGIMVGTPRYMAPEQVSGDQPIDARTDVYALGAVLHEMLAGESTVDHGPPRSLRRRERHEPRAALSPRRPDVSPFLDAAIRRAMSTWPEDRFPSAAAFSATLTEAAPVGAPQSRSLSARAFLYAAGVMLAIGLASGWALARSTAVERLENAVPTGGMPVIAAPRREVAAIQPAPGSELSLAIADRSGNRWRTIAAQRPWTPRFSPDGRRVAYGAFGPGRSSSDLWITELATGATKRLTDDDGDSNDPQWSADGASLAYSVGAPGGKDVVTLRVGKPTSHVVAAREGMQFPSDWLRDGSAMLVTDGEGSHDVIVQPADGSSARAFAASPADETAARASPDGRWVAYTSDESGRPEVYLAAYSQPDRKMMVSVGGGIHPVWRGDGRELYYWRDDALMAVTLEPGRRENPPSVVSRSILFRAPYQSGLNTMYDVSPDGTQFVIVLAPKG